MNELRFLRNQRERETLSLNEIILLWLCLKMKVSFDPDSHFQEPLKEGIRLFFSSSIVIVINKGLAFLANLLNLLWLVVFTTINQNRDLSILSSKPRIYFSLVISLSYATVLLVAITTIRINWNFVLIKKIYILPLSSYEPPSISW